MTPIEVGSTIAGYRIVGVLGRGGMGVVYRADQPALGRQVAIKVIAPELAGDEAFRERFKRESRLAAAIEHPHSIPIYEAGEDGGTTFLVMRHIDGTDLRTLIANQRRLGAERAARIIEQVAGALDEAHARGLVHRDVKPGNVLIASQRGRDHAYLTDFGLTKQASSASALTRTGQWVGTVDYAAPEQIEGKRVDARTDVYALGCVLFEALTGRVPFDKEADISKLFAHVNEPPPAPGTLVEGLPPALDEVTGRALAKDPDERFPSAGDLGRAIVAATEGHTVAAPERTVAAGAAAPAGGETVPAAGETVAADETVAAPADTVPAAGETVAAPGETVPAADETVAAEAAATADATLARPATGTAGAETRGRRRRLLMVGGPLAAVVAVAAVAAVLLAGGGDGEPENGAGGQAGQAQREQRGDRQRDGDRLGPTQSIDAGAYRFEAPEDWSMTAVESADADRLRTDVINPSGDFRLTISRRRGDPAAPAAQAAGARESARAQEPFNEISFDDSVTVAGRESARFEFDKRDRHPASPLRGPTRAVAYFLSLGGDSYRVQSNVELDSDDIELANTVARHAARTLQPG